MDEEIVDENHPHIRYNKLIKQLGDESELYLEGDDKRYTHQIMGLLVSLGSPFCFYSSPTTHRILMGKGE